MTSRLHRLWAPGAPQRRVFLPNFWMKLVQPSFNEHLPPNMVKFVVHTEMTRHDVREHLTKIYGLPVRDVRTELKRGALKYDVPAEEPKYKTAIDGQPDYLLAYVTMRKDFRFSFPHLFPADPQFERQMKFIRELSAERRRPNFGDSDWFAV